MGLFSRVRRLNGAAASAESAAAALPPDPTLDLDTVPQPAPIAPAASPPRPATASVSSLRDGLQQIYSIRPSRDAFAEEAVKLIARGAGVKAAALLGYEQRGGRMRLLAHVGIDSDAIQILSGDSMVSAWDIPLRSLRNRRINVIEAAQENPFVPKALIAISPRRLTIAALPFFHANAPVGVIVLFSPTARGFADGLLKALSQSLRVCALALSELPPAGAATARPLDEEAGGAQPNLLRGLAALKAELARLSEALDEAERQRAAEAAERVTAQSFLKAAQERSAQLEQELAELRAAGQRVPEIEEQVHSLSRRLAAATEAADAAQTQVAQLQAAVAQGEQRAERDAGAIADLAGLRKQLEQQLQSALDTARQRGEEAAALHAQVADLAPRAAQASDLQTALAATEAAKAETEVVATRLRQELRAAQDQGARSETALAQASAALAASETDRAAVAAQLGDAQDRLAELARAQQELAAVREQAQALEAVRAAREQELDAARAALGAGGQELAATAQRAAARIAELDAERARLADELDRTRAQAEQAAAELQRHAAAVQALQQDLDGGRSALAQAETERGQLAARLAGLEREVEAARAAGATLEARLAEQSEASSRLAAERRELQTRIDALTVGGQSLEQERQAAVSAARQRGAELEAEIGRLTAALDAARSQAASAINRTRDDATATLDGLRVDLAEAVRGRDALQRALGAAQQECAAHQRALADMSAERTRLEAAAERWNAERSELSARIDTGAAERTTLQRAHDEAAARVSALEGDLHAVREQQLAVAETQLAAEREARQLDGEAFAAAEARYQEEIAELRDRLALFNQEQTRLAKELEEKQLLLQSAEHDLTAAIDLSSETDDDDSVLDIDRDYAPEGATSAAAEGLAEVDDDAGGDCVLLDGDEIGAAAARQLAEFGHRVSALAPTPDASDTLKDRTVACAAVNLAAPNAWALLRHMRNGSGIPRMPLIAYALATNAPKGFWLGAVDFAVLPVAQTDLTAMLNRLVPKVKRVIAMSNDIDVMSDVRTQLTGAGISTAVVLDGRQALDLVPTIRPEAAVLHLSPSCVDVFRAIAGLRSAEISRDIPIVFLLDAEAQPREEAFLTAGLRMLTGRGSLAPDGLVDSLASAFDGYRAV
jgi:CheY-like chemotaxis protein/predicted  nucleic acid-binding Zn-ribbon protein